jgi:type VI protein secretion system component VasK
MKITESELKNIIDEEIQAMIDNGEIDENILTRLKARAKGGLQGLAGKAISKLGGTQAGAEIQSAANRKKGAVVLADYSKKIDAMVAGMVKDLEKLGLDIQADSLKPVKQALGSVRASNTRLKNLLPQLAGTGQQAGGTSE